MRYVARNERGEFLTARRSTGRMYENRSTWSKDIDDAKIFNTSGAAKNAANKCPDKRAFGVVGVEVHLVENRNE